MNLAEDIPFPLATASPVVSEGIMHKPRAYRIVKRGFDIAFSTCVIVVGAVPGALLAVVVAADTKAFPIYSQTRVGKGGKPFRILKYRTMVANADELLAELSPSQEDAWHREHKLADDPRITKLGRFLRATSIDEVPQFVNVLLGQISVVGPRPITFEELEYFGADKALLLSCPPGITGIWQTGPRNAATFESGERQALDLEYVRNASLLLDARLIMRTFKSIVERTGK